MSRLTLTIIDRSYSNLSPFYTLLLRAMPKVSLITQQAANRTINLHTHIMSALQPTTNCSSTNISHAPYTYPR